MKFSALILTFLLFHITVSGVVLTSVQNGDFNDPNVWDLSVIPTGNDVVIIKHNITATNPLFFFGGGGINIEEAGTFNFDELTTQANVTNFGLMNGNMFRIESVTFTNHGLSEFIEFTNADGNVQNHRFINITNELVNSGQFTNYKTLRALKVRNLTELVVEVSGTFNVGIEYYNQNTFSSLKICGKVKLGFVDDSNNPITGNTIFRSEGTVEGCGGGIYDEPNVSIVTNDGIIAGNPFLCQGTTSTYSNNNPLGGDFITDCCFKLTADAGVDKTVCSGDNILLGGVPTASNGTEPYEYAWTTVAGTLGSNSVANPIASTTVTTKFYVNITDANSCTTVDSVEISTDTNVLSNAGIDKFICEGESTTIGAITAATCGVEPYTFQWTPTAGLADPTAPQTTASPAFTTKYFLEVTDANSVTSVDSMIVYIDPRPTVAMAGGDQMVCGNSTTLEGNTPTKGSGFWSIISGNANIADPTDPNSPVSGLVSGEVVVLVWTISFNDCESRDEVELSIVDAATEPTGIEDQVLCESTSTQMAVEVPDGMTVYWSVVSGTASVADNTDPQTQVDGIDEGETVVLTLSTSFCANVNTYSVSIEGLTPASEADAGQDIRLCDGESRVDLNAVEPEFGSGNWIKVSGPGTIENPDKHDSRLSGLTPGSTTVLRWQVSQDGCSTKEDEVIVTTGQSPTLDVNQAEICEGESVQINFSNASEFIWSETAGVSDTNIPNPVLSPSTSTTYNVEAINPECGSSSFSIEIIVNPSPVVTISENITIKAGDSTPLEATGGTEYLWTPGESLSDPTSASPIASPVETTTYSVEVRNDNGCSTSAEVLITVDNDFEIFVPEMFSPNGDGSNDILYVNTIGIETLDFKIFDRHGKLLFQTSQITEGWDGTYKGNIQSMDSYVYVVTAKTYNGTTKTEQGSVQLVR